MKKEISKSPEVLKQEALIKKLQAQLKKRKSTLKGLKTRLENSKKEIEEVQFKASTQMVGIMERMDEVRREIAELSEKMKKIKGLSKRDQHALEEMTEAFTQEDMFGEDFQEFQRKKAEQMEGNFDFEENARAKIRDLFEGLQVQPDEQEQKDIRKVFVKLANKFHPDRARTKKEELEFHEMQQKLNDAYQSGDIQTLLDMERMYLLEELDLSEAKSYTVDVLAQAVLKLEKEVQFINNQISRCQAEIKNLRNSEFGSMLTDLKKAKKEGYGFDAQMVEMEAMLQMLMKVRDVLKDSVEEGKISDSFMEMAMGGMGGSMNGFPGGDADISPEELAQLNEVMGELFGKGGPMNGMSKQEKDNVSPEQLEEMLGSLFGKNGSDFFDRVNAEAEKAYVDAKYKPAQTVRITKAIGHPALKKVKLKNFVGRVIDVGYTNDKQLEYTISLDSVSLKQLPKEVFEISDDLEIDFQDVDVLEKALAPCEPRDTEEENISTFRSMFHQYKWKHLGTAQSKRLQKILLTHPDKNDEYNWKVYLSKEVKYPFTAYTTGMVDGQVNKEMIVSDILGYNDDFGFIADVNIGKKIGQFPLFDLQAKDKKSPVYHLLKDFCEWQMDYLDDDDEDDDDFFF